MPRMEIWRGVWLVDRPMRTKFRVKIGVPQRAYREQRLFKVSRIGSEDYVGDFTWLVRRLFRQ
jgi:hypothetical protein